MTQRNTMFFILLAFVVQGCGAKKIDVSPEFQSETTNQETVALLENFDFSEGEYSLYATFWSEGMIRHEKANKLGMFYTNDSNLLDKLKSSWVFNSGHAYECGYDYTIYLTKKDSVIEEFNINIGCASLVCGLGNFQFPENGLDIIQNNTDTLELYSENFSDQNRAVTKLNELRKDSSFFIPYDKERSWEKFPGYFMFTTQSPYKMDKDSTNLYVINKLAPKFKPYQYELEIRGYGSSGDFDYRIYCDSTLMNDFDQFERTKNYQTFETYSIKAYKKLHTTQ